LYLRYAEQSDEQAQLTLTRGLVSSATSEVASGCCVA